MKTPQTEAQELVEYGESLAEAMLEDMTGEECVQMVRDFCGVMADWQPNIRENLEDPILLGCTAWPRLICSSRHSSRPTPTPAAAWRPRRLSTKH